MKKAGAFLLAVREVQVGTVQLGIAILQGDERNGWHSRGRCRRACGGLLALRHGVLPVPRARERGELAGELSSGHGRKGQTDGRTAGTNSYVACLFGTHVMRVRACARNMSRVAMTTKVECVVVAWRWQAVAPTSAPTMVPCRRGGHRSALGSQPLAPRPRARQNLPEISRRAKRGSPPLSPPQAREHRPSTAPF